MHTDLHPLVHFTDHPILDIAEEAHLVAVMRAGRAAQETLDHAPSPARPDLRRQDFGELSRAVTEGTAARATLIRYNMRLVVSLARKHLAFAGSHLTLDDLVSFGTQGLITGIDRFDPTKSGKLSTYVTWWIRQAIGRGIADEGRTIRLPVHVHDDLALQRRVRNRLSQHLGGEPTPVEIAADLGWTAQQVAHLEAVGRDTMSLNTPVGDANDHSELGDYVPDRRFDPEDAVLESSLQRDIATALARLLTPREQRLVRAYFGFDTGQKATLEAIGASEGVTRERVRQVIACALTKLRADPVIAAYGAFFTT